jgi:hypothetical protein
MDIAIDPQDTPPRDTQRRFPGGFWTLRTYEGNAILVLLMPLKTVVDVVMHVIEHKGSADRQTRARRPEDRPSALPDRRLRGAMQASAKDP